MKPFIAIDGEAVDDRYVLMCAAQNGTRIQHMWAADEKRGLDTASCLEFLLALARKGELVCFGLNYDANNWLKDIPLPQLYALQKDNIAYWFDYRIEWLPGRWFSVKHIDGRYVKIQEVFGFYQSSFVKALDAWGLRAGAEVEQMKQLRGRFSAKIRARVLDYCYTECEQLSELMSMLRSACADADIMPRSWIGAGAIASALLNRQGVGDHHAFDVDIARAGDASEHPAVTAVLRSYFGGRVELLGQGIFPRVHTIDIRSAYPSAAQFLPSLQGARLHHRKRYNPNAQHAVWHVEWDCTDDPRTVMPFPAREKKSIYYPRKGRGWYHAVEVAAALALGYNVRVLEGWTLRTHAHADDPFAWIPALYAERAKLKRAGRPAEKVVKLALNSVYGKLAQGKGFGARPRWQSYMWAGEITASTRAKMLLATARIRGPVMISTDGIFALSHTMRDQSRLGGWELGAIHEMFAGQPGVYSGVSPDGKEVVKSRGFFAREVDYDELAAGWRSEGIAYIHQYESTRFIGLGTSLHRGRLEQWRRWITERRTLALAPQRKQISENGISPWPHYVESEPYTPKGDLFDTPEGATYAAGMEQPLDDF